MLGFIINNYNNLKKIYFIDINHSINNDKKTNNSGCNQFRIKDFTLKHSAKEVEL